MKKTVHYLFIPSSINKYGKKIHKISRRQHFRAKTFKHPIKYSNVIRRAKLTDTQQIFQAALFHNLCPNVDGY
ncbi:hypothetical protein BamIOP4010DRAFT_2050 [Burkholderia ambifaria IOP40-10]|uniref:Uncharacterized protein n=1 Tax=Burkholderia ambifaria IOP40-10 TaxID=396596 RepID=B1FDE1_9BURK|nr:hypothetical protein BamIOP4010DRAFT_2050 [Burkholderia ambifaria IOP40-10]